MIIENLPNLPLYVDLAYMNGNWKYYTMDTHSHGLLECNYIAEGNCVYEIDGVDYHFVSEEKFNELSQNGFFAEQATYNGWHYGSAIEDYMEDNVVAVLTPHGLRQIKKIDKLDIVSIYINVPRRDRLVKILQRGDNIEEAYRRSLSDVGQFDGIIDEVDYIIDNPGYEIPISTITNICHQKMCEVSK